MERIKGASFGKNYVATIDGEKKSKACTPEERESLKKFITDYNTLVDDGKESKVKTAKLTSLRKSMLDILDANKKIAAKEKETKAIVKKAVEKKIKKEGKKELIVDKNAVLKAKVLAMVDSGKLTEEQISKIENVAKQSESNTGERRGGEY